MYWRECLPTTVTKNATKNEKYIFIFRETVFNSTLINVHVLLKWMSPKVAIRSPPLELTLNIIYESYTSYSII